MYNQYHWNSTLEMLQSEQSLRTSTQNLERKAINFNNFTAVKKSKQLKNTEKPNTTSKQKWDISNSIHRENKKPTKTN